MNKTNHSERKCSQALAEADSIVTRLGLPLAVRQSAAYYFKKMMKHNNMDWKKISEFAVASVYIGCRKQQLSRSLDEISDATYADRKDIGHAFKTMKRSLSLNIPEITPYDFIVSFCESLGLPEKIQHEATEIINQGEKKNINISKTPPGITAAAIYIACKLKNENKTQKQVADVAQVSEVTIRNRVRDLTTTLNIKI